MDDNDEIEILGIILDTTEAAQLLEDLRNFTEFVPQEPPADILDHVPEDGVETLGNRTQKNRRDLLLSSIAVITAIIGAGFVFMQQLFEASGYDFMTALSRPTWGEYLVKLTSNEKQRWCANTARYIDAMKNNTPLEVVTIDGNKIFKPLSGSQSETGNIITPTLSMRLNGNETIIKINGIMVYNHINGAISLPDDPIEVAAFCMAHFFHNESVQTLVNWGPDFKLISEIDLLQILGELRNGHTWKEQIIGSIFENAFEVYKQTTSFNEYIIAHASSVGTHTQDLRSQLGSQLEEFSHNFPQYRDQCLLKIAKEQPTVWWVGNQVATYPIQTALIMLWLTYRMRKEICHIYNAFTEIGREGLRFVGWLRGQNPDVPGQLLIMNRPDGGGSSKNNRLKKTKKKNRQKKRKTQRNKKVVIVINNSLSDKHIEKLLKLFGNETDIDSFSKEIYKIKKISFLSRVRRKIFGDPKSVSQVGVLSEEDMSEEAMSQGGKRSNKKSTKRRKQYRHKTQKR